VANDPTEPTCATRQQALTALADPRRLPAELHAHVKGCVGCRGFRRGLLALDRLVPQIPVPSSPPHVRADFLANLPAESGLPPIIVRRPAPKPGSSPALVAARGIWAAREQWQYAAGIAAMLTLGVGLWWVSAGPRVAAPEVAKMRHELLSKEVTCLAALTRAETPAEKVAAWTRFAADVQAEAKLVYKAAPDGDMQSLERMYARAVSEGLLTQAALLPPGLTPAQRQAALAAADGHLQRAATEAEALAQGAPPASRGPLLNIAAAARAGQARLTDIVHKGA
jgi:hypothetical protein